MSYSKIVTQFFDKLSSPYIKRGVYFILSATLFSPFIGTLPQMILNGEKFFINLSKSNDPINTFYLGEESVTIVNDVKL